MDTTRAPYPAPHKQQRDWQPDGFARDGQATYRVEDFVFVLETTMHAAETVQHDLMEKLCSFECTAAALIPARVAPAYEEVPLYGAETGQHGLEKPCSSECVVTALHAAETVQHRLIEKPCPFECAAATLIPARVAPAHEEVPLRTAATVQHGLMHKPCSFERAATALISARVAVWHTKRCLRRLHGNTNNMFLLGVSPVKLAAARRW